MDTPAETIEGCLLDLRQNREFRKHTRSIDAVYFKGGALDSVNIYLICRATKPSVIVETGVASGMSSTFILQALEDNSKGTLISIDIPNYDEHWLRAEKNRIRGSGQSVLPPGRKQGRAVPERLRDRWHLILGKTEDLLVPTLSHVSQTDLVLLDDDHSYDHVTWECEVVQPYLARNGILVVDDTSWNSSFSDFVSKKRLTKTLQLQRASAVRMGNA